MMINKFVVSEIRINVQFKVTGYYMNNRVSISVSTLVPTQSSIKLTPDYLSHYIKRPERQADHFLLPSTEVNTSVGVHLTASVV